MQKTVGIIRVKSLKRKSVVLVKIPNNPDNLSVIVYRKENQIHAWLNSCPHEGRKLCNDPDYLFNKKNNLLECMHHQASFHPISGKCEMGPCKGKKLLKYETVEFNNKITILETRF
tara:strand:- start:1016 stop:1363 length:348 start_codon:yes stop_codon:yes gene_type:complete